MNKVKSFLFRITDALDKNPLEEWFEGLFRNRKQLLVIGIVGIVLIHTLYFVLPVDMNMKYRRADATGFNHWWAQEFVYHYYYNGLFPLVTTAKTKDFSKEGAKENLYTKPDSLLTEWKHWSRFGESARIWLYMPYTVLTGSAAEPQISFTNYLVLTITLSFLFYLFWKRRQSFFGIILVLILGCSPFIVYETYCNNNVFGLMATYAMLLTGLYLPIFKGDFRNKYLLLPVIAGVLAGVMYHIRAESAAMLLAPLLIVWLIKGYKFWVRLTLCFILILTFYLSNITVKSHFENLKQDTNELVKELGGTPFEGGKTLVHPLWHPLYCGLGDFDDKYGHVLHDTAAYRFALPILRKKTGEALVYPGRTKYEMGDYYDADSLYYKKVETIPGYAELVKEYFINDVSKDPIWYGGILLKRVGMFLFNLSPVGIFVYKYAIPLPFHGFIVVLFAILLFVRKKWFWLKLMLFTAPLGVSVIAIFYLDNNSYQSIFHLFSFAILAYGLGGAIYNARQKTKH